MKKMRRSALLLSFGAAWLAAATPAAARVHYVYTYDSGAEQRFFDLTSNDFITAGSYSVTPGPKLSCSRTLFGNSVSCDSVTLMVRPADDAFDFTFGGGGTTGDAFASGTFGQVGTFGSRFGGSGSITISGSPGAPAPLLGLGLLPALAGAGGLAATRRRRKVTLNPASA